MQLTFFLKEICMKLSTLAPLTSFHRVAGLTLETLGAFHFFFQKNPEISVGAKVESPIGKKVFHLVVNPGT